MNPDQAISGGDDVIAPENRVYQKGHHKHVAFRPSDVSEMTETDEDVLIIDVSDDMLERAVTADVLILNLNVPDDVLGHATATVDSAKWCGDQRTKYAVLKVEAISFALAVICVTFALTLVSAMFPDAF
jgi:hypothetical protein